MGLMLEKLLEKETRRRDNVRDIILFIISEYVSDHPQEPQTEHNTRTEQPGGLLNRVVTIILRLLQVKSCIGSNRE